MRGNLKRKNRWFEENIPERKTHEKKDWQMEGSRQQEPRERILPEPGRMDTGPSGTRRLRRT